MKQPKKLTAKQRARNARHSAKKKDHIVRVKRADFPNGLASWREEGKSDQDIVDLFNEKAEMIRNTKVNSPYPDEVYTESEWYGVNNPGFPVQGDNVAFMGWPNGDIRVFCKTNPQLTLTYLTQADEGNRTGREEDCDMDAEWSVLFCFQDRGKPDRCWMANIICENVKEATLFCLQEFPILADSAVFMNDCMQKHGPAVRQAL